MGKKSNWPLIDLIFKNSSRELILSRAVAVFLMDEKERKRGRVKKFFSYGFGPCSVDNIEGAIIIFFDKTKNKTDLPGRHFFFYFNPEAVHCLVQAFNFRT